MKHLILSRKIPFFLGFLLLLVSSCTPVRLISDYDEVTDKTITALQEKVSGFFVKIEAEAGTKDADYSNYKTFYQESKTALSTLKIRTDAIDNNKIVQDQVTELTKMMENLERLHKAGFGSAEIINPLEQPFNTAFTALIKLQMGLKRGKTNK